LGSWWFVHVTSIKWRRKALFFSNWYIIWIKGIYINRTCLLFTPQRNKFICSYDIQHFDSTLIIFFYRDTVGEAPKVWFYFYLSMHKAWNQSRNYIKGGGNERKTTVWSYTKECNNSNQRWTNQNEENVKNSNHLWHF
jgi:hypothetical protein